VGVALKFSPLIVTVVPTAPTVGENEVIVGCENALLKMIDSEKDKRMITVFMYFKNLLFDDFYSY
jgi:hypothetical protein